MTGGGAVTTANGMLTIAGNVNANAAPTTSTITGQLSLGTADRTLTVADGAAAIDLLIDGIIQRRAGRRVHQRRPGHTRTRGLWHQRREHVHRVDVRQERRPAARPHFEGALKTLIIGDGTGAAGSAVVRLGQGTEIPDDAVVSVSNDGRLDLAGFPEQVGRRPSAASSGGDR